ncbi:MAG: transglycosylase SLT domain-containing protein [Oligoflexia bacterium]|nr:transglycosylase SLT domain-containing protein [Oligoflexia bacterium]
MKPVVPLFALLLLLPAAAVSAAPTALPAAALLPQPIDSLQEKIRKPTKNRPAQTIKKAYDALREGKTAKARSTALALKDNATFADFAEWIIAAAYFEDARKAFQKRQLAEVERLARASVAATGRIPLVNPYSPLLKSLAREIAQAELLSGSAFCAAKKWKPCRDRLELAFQRLGLGNELGAIRPQFLSDYGLACGKAPGELCDPWLQRLVSFFPKNSAEVKTLLAGAPDFERRVPPGHARATRSYKAPDLDQTAFDGPMTQYLQQKYADAVHGFRQFLDDYPRSTYRFRARYWLAQALTQEQKHDEAKSILDKLQNDGPLTYYGMLASIASGRDLGEPIDGSIPSVFSSDAFLTPQEKVRLSRAETLLAAGAPELAAIDLRDLRARDPLSSPFLLYLAMLNHEAGNHSAAFSILSELFQRNYAGVYTTYVLRLIFPVEHLEVIQQNAQENKLDPILVLSLIKQESGFDSGAASGSGAQGLMQLMPATAADVFPELSRVELLAIEANIRTGTRYLGRMMARFNGNIALALAAYNAGPNAVDRWVKGAPQQRGLLEFIESIPYKETREYVAAIIRNYFWYSRSLNWESQKTLPYFWNVYGPPEAPGGILPVAGPGPAPGGTTEEE